jgi:hypothetical protein
LLPPIRLRQHLVTRISSVIERQAHSRLLGKRAEPFAILVDEATKIPAGQLKFDHRKRCIKRRTRSVD